MIDLIKDIFQTADFEVFDAGSFFLFTLKDRTSFWLVKELDSLDFIKDQDELFIEARKAASNNPVFDKNVSLLLLNKVTDDVDLKEIKKQTLEIEEDPYQFKKQVLFYTDTSYEELSVQLLLSDFKNLLSSQKIFKDYKDDYNVFSWQALLYRIAQKLPFIEITVEQNKDLTSLFDENATIVKRKGLDEINNRVNYVFTEKTASEIKELSADDVFDLLLTEEEKGNWNENK